MKKKRLMITIIQFLLVGTFGFSLINYVQKEIQPTNVYQFKNAITVNSEIAKTDLEVVQIPKKAVTDKFITKLDDVVGHYATTNISAGQYVEKDFVEEKDNIDPFKSMDMSDLRKISIPINNTDTISGNLKKGEKVDLVYTGKGEKADVGDFNYAKAFMQGVYVWGINTDDGFQAQDHSQVVKGAESKGDKTDKEKISTETNTDKPTSITLAVTLDQAEEISSRLKSGAVRVVGRFAESEDYNSLGFVLGDYQKVFSGNANAETSSNIVK